jgi:hypothetical protein
METSLLKTYCGLSNFFSYEFFTCLPCDSTCARCETIATHCTHCSYSLNREMTPSSNKCICREEFIEDSEGNCIWLGEGDFASTKTAV